MNTKRIAIIVVAALSLYFATAGLAWENQEQYQNNMDVPAYDLTKILEGNYDFTEVIIYDEATAPAAKFKEYVVTYPAGHTKIHWFNGQVGPGEKTWACFSTGLEQTVNVIAAYWTDEEGNKLGEAGPPVASEAINYLGSTTVELRNSWVRWDHDANVPGEPVGRITISNVSWAITEVNRPLEELDERLYDPDLINWNPLGDDVPLAYGETATYELGNLDKDTIVLFRFVASGAGQTSEEIIQFIVGPSIPTVSQWGLIVMAALLVSAGAIVIVRRRRRVAA